MKTALILLGLVGMQAETPAHFTADGIITRLVQLENGTTPGGQIQTTVINQDLTTPGWVNRFTLSIPYLYLSPSQGWYWVTVMADGEGRMWVLIPGWGMISLTPRDQEVWKVMKASTAFETRWQRVIITEHQILIEEPTRYSTESLPLPR